MRVKKYYLYLWTGVFLYFFIINMLTPLMGEDLALTVFPQNAESLSIAETLYLMWMRIYEQMTTWNIRVGEQTSIVFSCFDKVYFNICNSYAAILYISLIYQYAFKKKYSLNAKSTFFLLTTFSLILLFHPALGEIFFWQTGSTNYLWGLCLLLVAALPLRYYIGHTSIDIIGNSKAKQFLLIIISFFAGLTNENTIIVFISLYMGCIIYRRLKRQNIPIWIYLSGISLLAGFLVMLNAPSTAIRVQTYKRIFGITDVTMRDYIYRGRNIIIHFFSENKAYIYLTCIAIILYLICVIVDRKNSSDEKRKILISNSENLFLLLLSSLSCAALVMSPYIETRAFLLPDFFMLVCIIYYLEQILYFFQKMRTALAILLIIVQLIALSSVGRQIYQSYLAYNDFSHMREHLMKTTDKKEAFQWKEYRAPYSGRILSTREDYLSDNPSVLARYYGRNIQLWKQQVWIENLDEYLQQTAIGNIDTISYDPESDKLILYGWAVLEGSKIEDSSRYVYIRADNESYYFRSERVYREDVADYYSNDEYLNCGIKCEVNSVQNFLGSDVSDIHAGILTIDDVTKKVSERTIEHEIVFKNYE